MKTITIINKVIVILCVFLCSCNRNITIIEEEITDRFNFKNQAIISSDLSFTIDTLVIVEADKRRNGVVILPDEITIEVKITIENKSDKTQIVYMRENENINASYFYHHIQINENERKDSIILINYGVPDSIIIEAKERKRIILGSSCFDYEDLFSKQKDYTHCMITLLEESYFMYNSSSHYEPSTNNRKKQEFITFEPHNKTVVFSRNTKSQLN